MSVIKRNLSDEDWEPWVGEGYHNAYSTMMVQKTSVSAVSTRLIRLESGGHTGSHSHDRVHHVVAIEGQAMLETDHEKIELDHLVLVEISANVPHRFVNRENESAVILVLNLFK